jgi:hypothetical protein
MSSDTCSCFPPVVNVFSLCVFCPPLLFSLLSVLVVSVLLSVSSLLFLLSLLSYVLCLDRISAWTLCAARTELAVCIVHSAVIAARTQTLVHGGVCICVNGTGDTLELT